MSEYISVKVSSIHLPIASIEDVLIPINKQKIDNKNNIIEKSYQKYISDIFTKTAINEFLNGCIFSDFEYDEKNNIIDFVIKVPTTFRSFAYEYFSLANEEISLRFLLDLNHFYGATEEFRKYTPFSQKILLQNIRTISNEEFGFFVCMFSTYIMIKYLTMKEKFELQKDLNQYIIENRE